MAYLGFHERGGKFSLATRAYTKGAKFLLATSTYTKTWAKPCFPIFSNGEKKYFAKGAMANGQMPPPKYATEYDEFYFHFNMT